MVSLEAVGSQDTANGLSTLEVLCHVCREEKMMMHLGAMRHKICSHHSVHGKVHHLLKRKLSIDICEGLESISW